MLLCLVATLSLAAHAAGSDDLQVVVVPLSAVSRRTEAEPATPPATHAFQERRVLVVPGDESRVEVDFVVDVLVDGPVLLRLADAALAPTRVLLDGSPVPLGADPDGSRWLVVRGAGRHRVALAGTVASPGARLDLDLPPAARSTLALARADLSVTVDGGISASASSNDRIDQLPGGLHLSWRPVAPPAPRQTVVTAEAATAVAVEAAGAEGRATLRYRIANGHVSTVSFRLPAAAEAVTVAGSGVAGHSRAGDRIDVRLARPVTGSLAVDVAWRAAPPEGDGSAMPLALAWPVAAHPTGWATLLRADESLVVPEPGRSLSPIPSTAPPAWAQGLAPGAVVSAWRVDGDSPTLAVRLLRYDPVDAPPTLVDEARYEVAYAGHGTFLLRARYQVRNDRSQFLHVAPPAGTTLLGARVAGRVVTVARGEDGALRIPLEKSVETLRGLVSFPVEVLLWGDEADWGGAGRRRLVAPAIDAPIATARWEIAMPPGVHVRAASGAPRRVETWDRADAVEYGRGWTAGDEDAAGDTSDSRDRSVRRDQSQETWNAAYRAYQDNRFEQAGALLERSLELDPDNAAAQALKGNVEVLLGDDDTAGSGQGEAQARRIKEMAKAKTGKQAIAQAELQSKAEELLRAGDVEEAEQVLEELVVVTRSLAVVEQAESHDQKVALEESGKKLAEVRQAARARRKVADLGPQGQAISKQPASDPSPDPEFLESIPAGRSYQATAGFSGAALHGEATAKPTVAEAQSEAFPAIVEGITASPLTIHVPQGGELLRFEQQLLPADTPLTVEVRYRTPRRHVRSTR